MSDPDKPDDSLAGPAVPRAQAPQPGPAVSRTTTPQIHPIGTPAGLSPGTGSIAVAAWLRDRGIYPAAGKPWRVQTALEVNDRPASFGFAATKLQLTITPDEWGYVFTHGGRVSSIHVASYPAVRDRDEHGLLVMTPVLRSFGTFVRALEARYRIFFPRHHAALHTDLHGGEPMIRAWIATF